MLLVSSWLFFAEAQPASAERPTELAPTADVGGAAETPAQPGAQPPETAPTEATTPGAPNEETATTPEPPPAAVKKEPLPLYDDEPVAAEPKPRGGRVLLFASGMFGTAGSAGSDHFGGGTALEGGHGFVVLPELEGGLGFALGLGYFHGPGTRGSRGYGVGIDFSYSRSVHDAVVKSVVTVPDWTAPMRSVEGEPGAGTVAEFGLRLKVGYAPTALVWLYGCVGFGASSMTLENGRSASGVGSSTLVLRNEAEISGLSAVFGVGTLWHIHEHFGIDLLGGYRIFTVGDLDGRKVEPGDDVGTGGWLVSLSPSLIL